MAEELRVELSDVEFNALYGLANKDGITPEEQTARLIEAYANTSSRDRKMEVSVELLMKTRMQYWMPSLRVLSTLELGRPGLCEFWHVLQILVWWAGVSGGGTVVTTRDEQGKGHDHQGEGELNVPLERATALQNTPKTLGLAETLSESELKAFMDDQWGEGDCSDCG